TSSNNGVCHFAQVQLNGADCVVVTWDDVVNTLWAAVGVNDTNYRNAQFVGFADGVIFVINVDYKHNIRQTAHVFDTTKAALQLFQIAGAYQGFFFGQLVESAVLSLGFQFAQALDGSADGFVVGQHAAQPAVVNVRHAATLGLLTHDFAGGTLGANKQNFVLAGSLLLDEAQCFFKHWQAFFQFDDVDLVARTKNVFAHFWVPVASLVAEVNASLQHV